MEGIAKIKMPDLNVAGSAGNTVYDITSEVNYPWTTNVPGALYALDIASDGSISIAAVGAFPTGAYGPSQASPMCSADGGVFTDYGNHTPAPGVLGFSQDTSTGSLALRFNLPTVPFTTPLNVQIGDGSIRRELPLRHEQRLLLGPHAG